MDNHSISLFSTYDHEQCYEDAINGNYEDSICCLTNCTAYDKSVAPDGNGILNIFIPDHIKNWQNLSPEEYKKRKQEVCKILIKKAQRIISDLPDRIEVAELATPLTMQRYTGNPQGAIYGFAQMNKQSGISRFGSETPVKGLYLTGACTYPGAGYSSVISSGYKTAKMLLS